MPARKSVLKLELRNAGGEQVWVLLSFKPILDAQGNVVADRSLLEDITARKRLEEALQKYSEKLQELVNARTAQLRQSEERQHALLEINNAIISNLDRDSLFAAIARTLRSILPFDRLSLFIYDPVDDLLKYFAVSGIAAQGAAYDAGINVPRKGSMMGRAVDQKRPVIGWNLRQEHPDSVDDNIIAALVESGIRSYIMLPLIAGGNVVGVLNLTNLAPDQYSERDAEFLQEIAKQVAIAVENMQAYSWPGNGRELENIIERAVIISQGSRLDLGEWLPKPSVMPHASRIPTLEELESEHIISVLETTGWRVIGERGAAKLLGMKPTTLEARMKKLGVERKR